MDENSGKTEESGDLKLKDMEPTGNVRVLVVEDDPDIELFLKVVINKVGGFESTYTDNTQEALELLRKAKSDGRSFELVFSDKGLKRDREGGLDSSGGFNIAEAVKKEKLAGRFTLYTASAFSIGEDFTSTQLKEMGIDELLGKAESQDRIQDSLIASQAALRKDSSAQIK